MSVRKEKFFSVSRICFFALMAALVYVVTLFRFPLFGSKVHFSNAMCLLSGMLLGPLGGGIAAGLGSFLYDLLSGGYPIWEALITFASKFAMAWVCGMILRGEHSGVTRYIRLILSAICGAFTYVGLYMLKTFAVQHFLYGLPMNGTFTVMAGKLPASLINAVFAAIVSPVLFLVLSPALKRAGLYHKLRADSVSAAQTPGQ